jgi:hypothetical protein
MMSSTSRKDVNNDRARAIGDGATSRAPGQPPINLEFVDMNDTSKEAKEMNQKVIRSKAMRSYRQKKQFQRTKEEEAKTRNRARAVQPRSESKNDNHSKAQSQTPETINASTCEADFSDFSWLMSKPRSNNPNDVDSGREASMRRASPSSNHSDAASAFDESPQSNVLYDWRTRNFTQFISPVTLLGAGRIDPFRMSSSDMGPHIHELIDHCKSVSRCNKTHWF